METLKTKLYSFLFFIFIRLFKQKKVDKKIFLREYSQILIIHDDDYQTGLQLTPFIHILKKSFNSSISILANEQSSKIFNNNTSVENVIVFFEGMKLFTKTIYQLRKINFDAVIDPAESINLRSSIILGLLRAQNKIGFTKEDRLLLTHQVELLNSSTRHIVDRYMELMSVFETHFSKSNLNIVYTPTNKTKKEIEDYLIKHNLNYKPIVLINISSESKIGFWGIENYKRLLRYFRNYNVNVIVTASIDDIDVVEKIAESNYTVFYNTEFDLFAGLLKQASFLFSPDSYSVQLAAAFKVPVFCLFVQHNTSKMMNVPYNSDFDFVLTEKSDLSKISYGKMLNSFVPFFDYVYERYAK